MNTSRPASFWPPSTMPNSARLLDRVDGVAAGIGEADHLGLRGLRLQQEGGEVGGIERPLTLPSTLPPAALTTVGGVALERVAEGVVGGDEEPGVAAALDHRAAGAMGERVGVVGPVHACSACTCVPVRSDVAGPVKSTILFFSRATSLTASATDGGRHVGDQRRRRRRSYHWRAMLEPTSGLFWWSAGDHLDLLAEHRPRNPRPPSWRRSPSPCRRYRNRARTCR